MQTGEKGSFGGKASTTMSLSSRGCPLCSHRSPSRLSLLREPLSSPPCSIYLYSSLCLCTHQGSSSSHSSCTSRGLVLLALVYFCNISCIPSTSSVHPPAREYTTSWDTSMTHKPCSIQQEERGNWHDLPILPVWCLLAHLPFVFIRRLK